MAVTKTIENTILSLKQEIGTMNNGKPRYKTYSYSNIDTKATDQKLYAAATSLATLYNTSIDKIVRQDIGQIVQDQA